MFFKPEKCNVLHFTRKRTKFDVPYKISGHTLQAVTNHKYLGVTLSGDMKWNIHIDKAVAKANSMLGFMRRNLSNAPKRVKLQAYKSLVRPHIEYCSSVWDPFTTTNIKKIEAVQRRSARFIMNDYGMTSSVTRMLKEIQLPTLQERRGNQRLLTMHKIIHNHVDLPLDGHVELNTRSLSTSTRNHNPLSLKIPFSKTNCHQKSFFPNTARDWNNLPYTVTSVIDSTNFQKQIEMLSKKHD